MRATAMVRRLRVVTLVDRLQGGAERLAVDLTVRLDPRRFECALRLRGEMDPDQTCCGSEEERRNELRGAGLTLLGFERSCLAVSLRSPRWCATQRGCPVRLASCYASWHAVNAMRASAHEGQCTQFDLGGLVQRIGHRERSPRRR